MRKGIRMDDPEPTARYLGCEHRTRTETVDGLKYQVLEYDMQEFLEACLARYEEVARNDVKYRRVATPFVDESGKTGPCAPYTGGPWLECPWCEGRYAEPDFRRGKGTSYADGGASRTAIRKDTEREDDWVKGKLADGADVCS